MVYFLLRTCASDRAVEHCFKLSRGLALTTSWLSLKEHPRIAERATERCKGNMLVDETKAVTSAN